MKITLEYNSLGGVNHIKTTDAMTRTEVNENDLPPLFRDFYIAVKQSFREQMSILEYKSSKSSHTPIGKLEIELELHEVVNH